jgi:hypothetical protein
MTYCAFYSYLYKLHVQTAIQFPEHNPMGSATTIVTTAKTTLGIILWHGRLPL